MRRPILGVLTLGSSLVAAATAGAGIGPIYNAFPEGRVAVVGVAPVTPWRFAELGSMSSDELGATFAFPPGVTSSDLRTNLRAELERLGYTYLEDAASADFWADVRVGLTEVRRGSARYFANRRFVSSSPSGGGGNRVVVHTPGTSYGFSNGVFFGDPGGSVMMPGGGSSMPSVDSPELSGGPYQQELTLVLSDPGNGQSLLELLGSAPVNVANFRVGGQGILRAIARELPAAAESPPERDLGLDLAIWTADSKSYFPTVLGVRRGSPAARAGLRRYDVITAIAGQPTVDLTYSRIAELLTGSDAVELAVERGGRRVVKRLDQ